MVQDKVLINIINRLHNLEVRLKATGQYDKVSRSFVSISKAIEEADWLVHNPIAESYDETRSDCDASISGEKITDLYISDVIKPIIYIQKKGLNELVQRGIVIADSKTK